MAFDEVPNQSFDEREKEVLVFWERENVFKRSIEQRKHCPYFTFLDGPPFATGLPHYGHLLAGTIKDIVLRYKTMKGFYVPRHNGWDCHGLPVENEIEKREGLSGAQSIEEFGIARFNEACREIVLRYTEEWKETVARMGRWVSFDQTYRTMDLSFMESVWWVFQQIYEKGLVYEGYKVMPFSAKLGTPLSNFEAGENYQEVDDPSLTVAFPVEGEANTFFLAWTTTPWTLLSNLALMVGPDISYVKVQEKRGGRFFFLAKDRLSVYFATEDEYDIVTTVTGKQLIGMRYIPLFSFFASHKKNGAFRVIGEESVSTEEGTGIVHSAPAFGEVDFYACQREGISLVCPVDANGRFTNEIPEYEGIFVKDADKAIITNLKQRGHIVAHGTIRHRYPFCWRSDTPLIYRAMETWFIHVEKIKEQLLASNEQIHWTPHHLKYGRFGKWLEGARDWAISRNRYWGTPIPIWRADDGEIMVIGSVKELEEKVGQKLNDIHRHYIDALTIEKDGKIFRRIPEVFDCWFESGSMPYAQNHYPFENKEWVEKHFPADFIAEGLDQTRGWFYTLTVLATALFEKPAFKNVIVNGIVLAENGAKMSKRLQNYPPPHKVIHQYGADAIRLAMMHSPAVKADDMRFSESLVELVLRQILIPFWNAYSFFVTYARIYDWEPSEEDWKRQPSAVIDRWILSRLEKLKEDVEKGMEEYDLSLAVEPFVTFVDQLTNWYIRRSRRRFWEEQATQDRQEAFSTLYRVLFQLSQVAAPFVPFISEAIYQNLRQKRDPLSVHLSDFPAIEAERRESALEEEMAAVQTVVSLGHALRKECKKKVRQPLSEAHIVSANEKLLFFLEREKHLIAEELNVKQVVFHQEEKKFVHLQAKPQFRILGKKVGKRMRSVQTAIEQFDQNTLHTLQNGGNVSITIEGETIVLTPEDVEVQRTVHEGLVAANEGELTIALNTELTEELLIEGLARELVNKLNTMRREAGLSVTDRITITLSPTPRLEEVFSQHGPYITSEVLAIKTDFSPNTHGTLWDLNGEKTTISIQKAR